MIVFIFLLVSFLTFFMYTLQWKRQISDSNISFNFIYFGDGKAALTIFNNSVSTIV